MLRFAPLLLALAAPAFASTTTRYGYDALGRMTVSDSRATGGNGGRTSYTFDMASNRSRVSSSGAFKPVRILAEGELRNGQGILSNDTRFLFVFQDDANLVLYDQSMTPIWTAATQNSGASRAIMQQDGNFVLYRADGTPVWSTGTPSSGGNQLVVQNDGNAVIYTAQGVAVWSSGTCCR